MPKATSACAKRLTKPSPSPPISKAKPPRNGRSRQANGYLKMSRASFAKTNKADSARPIPIILCRLGRPAAPTNTTPTKPTDFQVASIPIQPKTKGYLKTETRPKQTNCFQVAPIPVRKKTKARPKPSFIRSTPISATPFQVAQIHTAATPAPPCSAISKLTSPVAARPSSKPPGRTSANGSSSCLWAKPKTPPTNSPTSCAPAKSTTVCCGRNGRTISAGTAPTSATTSSPRPSWNKSRNTAG